MRCYRIPNGYLKTDKEYPQFIEITEEEYLLNVPQIELEEEATETDYQNELRRLGVEV